MITKNDFKKVYLDFTKVKNSKSKTDWELVRIAYLSDRKDRMLAYSTYPIRDEFSIFKVAGRQKVTRLSCGVYQHSSYACKEHPASSIIHKKISCNKLGCPVCVGSAASVKARTIASRIEAIAEDIKYKYKDMGKPKHITFNVVVPKIVDYEKFCWLQKGIMELALKVGLYGGVIFHHSVRIDEDRKDLYESHHFHLIAYGNIIKSDKFFRKYRFTYRNHGVREDASHVVGTIQYIMSHSGLQFYELMRKNRTCWKKNYPRCRAECELKFQCRDRKKVIQHKPSYKYFGVMSPSTCSAKIIESIDVKAECPVCKEPLFYILEGLTLRYVLNPVAERLLKALEWANRPAIYWKWYTKSHYQKNGVWYKEEYCKKIPTTKYHYDIKELKDKLMIDHTQEIWKYPEDLTFSQEVLWEKKYVYYVEIRSLTSLLRILT